MGVGYCGNKTVYGSWLMDDNSLNGLEEMIKDIYEYLKGIQDNLKKEMPEEESSILFIPSYLREPEPPKIEVVSKDRVVVVGKTFKEINESLELRNQIVQKMSIVLRCLGMKVEVTLSSGDASANFFKYEVLGSEKIENYESYKNVVIGKIENWIDENKPDLLMFLWYKLAQVNMLLMALVIAIMLFGFLVSSGNKEQYYDMYNSEIVEIVDSGITEENRDRALELILLREYEYVPEEWSQRNNKVAEKILIAGLIGVVICIFVGICPKANFAVGKGKQRVKFWNCYRKVMFVIVPTVFIIPILINIFV